MPWVVIIIQLYDPEYLFLYGVSWGGTLALKYTVTEDYQNGIDGLIIEDGGHNMPLLMSSSIIKISEFAQTQIDLQFNVVFWQEAIDFFDQKNDSSSWGVAEFQHYASYFSELVTHPGITLGIAYQLFTNDWYELTPTIRFGWYVHPRNHHALFIESGILQKATLPSGFFF